VDAPGAGDLFLVEADPGDPVGAQAHAVADDPGAAQSRLDLGTAVEYPRRDDRIRVTVPVVDTGDTAEYHVRSVRDVDHEVGVASALDEVAIAPAFGPGLRCWRPAV
jgi:hypothetical protein